MERYQHERRLNFFKWQEEERAAERVGEINEIKHQSNATDAYGVLTLKRRDLATARALEREAQQWLESVNRHGQGFHDLKYEVLALKHMGLSVTEETAIALYEEHMGPLPKPKQEQQALPAPETDAMRAELVAYRDMLEGLGRPTDKVEAVLGRKK